MASGLYLTLLTGPMVPLPVPKPLIDALTSVEIEVSATGRSGFQLTFTLSDNSLLQTFFLLTANSPVPLLRVVIVVTLGGLPQAIMDGIIEHHEVVPDAMRGSSKLVVSGHDLSAMMDLVDFTGLPFPGMTPDLRVLTILGKYAAFGIVPEVMPVITPDIEVPVERIPTQKGTDFAYINQLAQEAGYVFYVQPGPVPGTSQAYWGPQVKVGVPQPALNVNLDAWTNVENLTFHYQPKDAVLPIVYIQEPTTKATIPIAIPPITPLNPPLGLAVAAPQKIEPLTDTAKASPAQALMRGMAKASDSADIVTGEGSLDVLRYGQILNARSLVGVRGAGPAFDGLHYVNSTKHYIKPGEYKQDFTLRRNALISNVPLVPTMPF
ncbi:hypothetical protein [Pseudacidobacterium ailaaui]|jgi:hypothetical protein|uniref:hypothetical protein n=1 Tax=Pseudacidobacterium ailaaui TaxID=1382359 RepID=UPI00047A0A32|nr:hypothetical protein [Pseudacidobacterium ailaaui]